MEEKKKKTEFTESYAKVISFPSLVQHDILRSVFFKLRD